MEWPQITLSGGAIFLLKIYRNKYRKWKEGQGKLVKLAPGASLVGYWLIKNPKAFHILSKTPYAASPVHFFNS